LAKSNKYRPFDLKSVCFTDTSNGWIVGDSKTILKTSNGGKSWFNKSQISGGRVSAVCFTDLNNGWIVGDSILHTTDSGANWGKQAIENYAQSVFFINSDTGWVACTHGLILKTTDRGISWIQQISNTIYNIWSIYFSDPNNGWAVGNSGTVLHTTNGGTNWIIQNIGTTNSLRTVYLIDSSNGWITDNSAGRVYHTTDGGTNWIVQNILAGYSINTIKFSNNLGWVAGPGGTILHTTDSGITWTPQTSGTYMDLYSVYFANSTAGWAVGQYGVILKYTGPPLMTASVNIALGWNMISVPLLADNMTGTTLFQMQILFFIVTTTDIQHKRHYRMEKVIGPGFLILKQLILQVI